MFVGLRESAWPISALKCVGEKNCENNLLCVYFVLYCVCELMLLPAYLPRRRQTIGVCLCLHKREREREREGKGERGH